MSRVSSPVLIGRSKELARLGHALDAARAGRSTTVVVSGEAGVGKTRLVTDFATAARRDGAIVLVGGCLDLGEGALPYGPVAEALRGLVRDADPAVVASALGTGRAELARLVPDLGPAGDGQGSSLSVGSGQGRLFEIVLGVLDRLATSNPVVFIVEDLHWSDRSTRDLLGFLVRNLRGARVMLLLTYRSDELHRRHPLLPFIAELERGSGIERVELRPLDRRDSDAQLRAILGRSVDVRLADSIHARSHGNPFFAEELLAAAGDDGATELPSTLRDVLIARVADLTEPTQEFLRVASAAGQRVDPSLLASAAGIDEESVYEALRESVGRQVLVPDETSGEERYAFRHALLQEAVYDDLLPGERTRLHSAFARALEAREGAGVTRAAEIAYHWYAAHDIPRAFASALAAAAVAEAEYAFPEALVQYERAIDLWDQVPDADARARRDRVELLAELAGVARFVEPARAVAHIQSAIALVDESVDPVRRGLLHERLGRYAWIAGQGELANRAYETAVRLIPADPPSEARARAVAGYAQILTLSARFAEGRRSAEEALTVARAVGAHDIEGHALNSRGGARAILGELEEGLEDLHRALAIAEGEGILDDIGRAYANIQWVLHVAGRFEDAVAQTEEALVALGRLGLMRFFGTHMLCWEADCLFRLGRWGDAEAAVRRASELSPFGINQILEQEMLARLAIGRGQLREAAERLRPLGPLAERAADIQFVGPVEVSIAELAILEGRPADAAARATAALAQIEHSPEVRIGELYAVALRAYADAAEVARARRAPGEVDAAVAGGAALLTAVRARHAETIPARPALVPQSEAWLLLAEAESSRLVHDPDTEGWARAVAAWDALGQPYVAAYGRWRQAEAALAAREDRAIVASLLREARATVERIGGETLRREIDGLASRARLSIAEDGGTGPVGGPEEEEPPRPAVDAASFGLTPREREVLGLVALGRTNRQIAGELFISENTAGVHVSNIIGKLGVASRGEAAAIAYRLGLVEPAVEAG